MKRPGCATRNHRWDTGKGKEGAKCLECGHEFGARPPRVRTMPGPAPAESGQTQANPSQPAPPPRAPNEALRAKWGLPNAAQQAQDAQQTQAQPEEKPAAAKADSSKVDITELVREGVPDLIVAGEQKTIKWCGRDPDEPHEKLKEKFDESFQKWSQGDGKLPKIEVPPGWAVIGLGLAMWIQMFMTGEKLPPRRRAAPASPDLGARNTAAASGQPFAHDTAGTPDPNQSPQSSPLTPSLFVVPDDGNATGAEPSSSGE